MRYYLNVVCPRVRVPTSLQTGNASSIFPKIPIHIFWNMNYAILVERITRVALNLVQSRRNSVVATPDMAEIKSQCEAGLIATHDCPAVFALAAIYAEITDAERDGERKEKP